MSSLAWVVPSSVLILGGLLKIIRQAGRIEEGIKGIYPRIDRIEKWIDRHDTH